MSSYLLAVFRAASVPSAVYGLGEGSAFLLEEVELCCFGSVIPS